MAHLYQDNKGITHQDPRVIADFRNGVNANAKQHAPLDYGELAALARDHSSPEKAILWDSLPAGEKRLAKQVNKAYSPKKSKLSKSAKADVKKAKKLTVAEQVMAMFGNSPDPSVREAARKIAGM